MPLDPSAVGRITDPIRVEWSWKECALYALGVGAGTDDLAFTTENTRGVVQRMLPTMPSILGKDFGVLEHLGRYDPHHLVHAGQVVELVQEVPTNASGIAQTSIVDMWDQGGSAIVLTETELRNEIDHSVLFRTRAFLLFKGEGGWGGHRMPPQVEELHEGDPDLVVAYETRRDQALLYRLSGDRNPLHSDPGFARRAGFERPILHGLCTFGFAGRAVLESIDEVGSESVQSLEGRFTSPVVPGDTLTVEIWRGEAVSSFRVRRSDGTLVMSHGRVALRTNR